MDFCIRRVAEERLIFSKLVLTPKKIRACFFNLLNKLTAFLGIHDIYLSNFDPYPDDEDKEIMSMSLSCDIAEIYEDIKTNLNVWKYGNIYDKQEMIYQFKWDWQNHTGDHWTFAVRAIHWKLHDLKYED
ncbi:MAG: hypothetical protein UZ05_CHB002000373 [Chlorobi bacterium OLB5]|nr:MAG: hypothetical protein UZ05_CHB002000373 [Chlorobi bacterium OLB5]